MADLWTPDAPRLLRLSRAAIGSLVAVMVADLLALCAEFFYVDYLRSLPRTPTYRKPTSSHPRRSMCSRHRSRCPLIVAGVVFIKWFRQAYVNGTSITGRATRHSSRWAIWGLFVPFLNMFRPQHMMREIWTPPR